MSALPNTTEVFTGQPMFDSHIERRGNCWHWTAACNGTGAPVFSHHDRVVSAARVAWMLVSGTDATGVLHRQCQDSRCINPAHRGYAPPPPIVRATPRPESCLVMVNPAAEARRVSGADWIEELIAMRMTITDEERARNFSAFSDAVAYEAARKAKEDARQTSAFVKAKE